MPREQIPSELLVGTHPRRRWLEAGVSRRELTGPLWARASHGMYAWRPETDDLATALHRIGGMAPPGGALGGWAAAHLLGATDLDGEAANGVHLPVLLCMPRRQTCRRVDQHDDRRVRVWRSDLEPEDVVHVLGTPVTSAVRTGFDLARLSPAGAGAGRGHGDAMESLVLLEALLRTEKTDPAELAEYAERHRRKAGAAQVRWVVEHAVTGTRSCQETRFRLLWTLDAGLPPPLVNAKILRSDGELIAEVDLLDPDAALAGEYDGSHHASADQRAADQARAENLQHLGLSVVRFASPDLTVFRSRTVHRLQTLYRQGLERDRRLDRWFVR